MERLLEIEREAAIAAARLAICLEEARDNEQLSAQLHTALENSRVAAGMDADDDEVSGHDLMSPRSTQIHIDIAKMTKEKIDNVRLLEVALGTIKSSGDEALAGKLRGLLVAVVGSSMETPVYDSLVKITATEEVSSVDPNAGEKCAHCDFRTSSKLKMMKHVDVEHGSTRRRANSSKALPPPARPEVKKVVMSVPEAEPVKSPAVAPAPEKDTEEAKKKPRLRSRSIGPRAKSSPDVMANTGPLKRDVEQEQIVQKKKMEIELKKSETPETSPLQQDEEQARLVAEKKKQMKEAEKSAVRAQRMRRRSTFSSRRSSKGSAQDINAK